MFSCQHEQKHMLLNKLYEVLWLSLSHKRVYRVIECEIIKLESISFLVTWPMGWCQCNTGHYLSNCCHPSFFYMQFDSSYYQKMYVCYFATVSGNMTLIFRNYDFLGMWLNISQLQLCFLQLQLLLQCDLYFTIASFCQYDSICLNCTHMVTYLTTVTLFPSIVTIYRNCDYITQGNLIVKLLFFSLFVTLFTQLLLIYFTFETTYHNCMSCKCDNILELS